MGSGGEAEEEMWMKWSNTSYAPARPPPLHCGSTPLPY